MKKKKNKLGIVLLVLAVLITIVAIILAFINKGEKTHIEDQKIIKDNYTTLSINVTDNIGYRTQLKNKLAEFSNDTYPEEYEEYVELLDNYTDNIKKIDLNYDAIDPRCDAEYEDSTTIILCRGYKSIYEETINIYIAIISEYNNYITKYNETSVADYQLYPMHHTEYLDLNANGEYQGKDFLINK